MECYYKDPKYCTGYNYGSWGAATGWRDSGAYSSSSTIRPVTRTVYATVSTWGTSTGWTTSGAYEQTTSRKPVTRTTIRYAG